MFWLAESASAPSMPPALPPPMLTPGPSGEVATLIPPAIPPPPLIGMLLVPRLRPSAEEPGRRLTATDAPRATPPRTALKATPGRTGVGVGRGAVCTKDASGLRIGELIVVLLSGCC